MDDKKLIEIVRALLVVEQLKDDRELRGRLVDAQVLRVESWKAGVYRA